MPSAKFFKALAEALAYEKPSANWNPNKLVQWESDVRAVARCLRESNENFRVGRFYDACGYVPSGEIL